MIFDAHFSCRDIYIYFYKYNMHTYISVLRGFFFHRHANDRSILVNMLIIAAASFVLHCIPIDAY